MKLELCNISKSFGAKNVLNDVSLTINSKGAFGLLGRNGAGKTTTIRIVMDVFPPDSGTVTTDGKSLAKSGLRIGYLPEERGMYAKKNIDEQLIYFGQLKGMSKKDAYRSAKYWVDRFDLSESFNKKLLTLSKGNQQKIQLAATLINDPDIIILDEPFSGLDPVNAKVLKDVIFEQVAKDKIVLFSSHQMGYIEEFCTVLAIIDNGNIVLDGNLQEIKRSYKTKKIFLSSDDDENLYGLLSDRENGILEGIRDISKNQNGITLQLADFEFKNEVFKFLSEKDVAVNHFSIMLPSLEDIFIEKVGR